MNAPIKIQSVWTIRALHDGKRCFAQEYLESLPERDRKKLMALLRRASQYGPRKNKQKFRKLEGDIFEFKSFQDRLYWFYQPNNTIVLTHGSRKKADRADRAEIDRATDLMSRYLEDEGG